MICRMPARSAHERMGSDQSATREPWPHSGTLSGLAKRALPGTPISAVKIPDDLAIAAHA